MRTGRRALVVGAGPNGLTAAITLAQAGCRVVVLEANDQIGGGARSAELTLPGYRHDVCSAVHPLAALSPCWQSWPLGDYGLEWIEPPLPLAHPLDDGAAVLLHRSLNRTADALGADGPAYRGNIGPIVERWKSLAPTVLGPPTLAPRHPWAVARFARQALRPASALAAGLRGAAARALWAGLAAHSMLPLERRPSAGHGLVLAAAAHLVGWPIPRGGAQRISDALAAYLRALGGEIHASATVVDGRELEAADIVISTASPEQMAGWTLFGPRERRRLRQRRAGCGVCKVDWALSGPIPWAAADCARAGTVHVGGGWEEIAAAERAPGAGQLAERPFVLVAQPTQFDPTRAPAGGHIAWAYCHVPNGSDRDRADAIEAQIERFAPGFRGRILARHVTTAARMQEHDPNLAGGDIGGGAQDLLAFAQRFRRGYRTAHPRVFAGSAATPPFPGVHGLCGHYAARAALSSLR
ncbi:MAG: phytoene desaturase family protein [Terriglobales bacterium]